MQRRDSVKSNADENTFYIAEQIDCATGKKAYHEKTYQLVDQ